MKNKYIRNRSFRIKHWKRIRAIEHPFETFDPWFMGKYLHSSEEQVQRHFKRIAEKARALESGKKMFHATSDFRRVLNKQRKAREKAALEKLRSSGNYDIEFPIFKKDADWLYF